MCLHMCVSNYTLLVVDMHELCTIGNLHYNSVNSHILAHIPVIYLSLVISSKFFTSPPTFFMLLENTSSRECCEDDYYVFQIERARARFAVHVLERKEGKKGVRTKIAHVT